MTSSKIRYVKNLSNIQAIPFPCKEMSSVLQASDSSFILLKNEGKFEMAKMIFILSLVLGLLAFGGRSFGQGYYKWVDEKGTVHFTDTPPSGNLGEEEKITTKEDAMKTIKGLETGNRYIPEDMRKYGPAGGSVQRSRASSGGGPTTSGGSGRVRRG